MLPIFLVTVVTRINWGNFASQSGNIFAKFGTKYQVSGRIDEHKFRKGKILLELSNFPNRQSVSSFFISSDRSSYCDDVLVYIQQPTF